MSENPSNPNDKPNKSFVARESAARAARAETTAMGLMGAGALLLLIGTVLALLSGRGWFCLVLGGVLFVSGCIENVRAEVLHVRAKLEKD